ncbi:hypothetical protein GCM10011328_31190 [Hafnia psychrotolerans]|uniref:Uncharacterized protein n=1 Tax=Hafnia psychrotolerans TaxID=1477018 RepID=A0ABQ1H033_9GAMM|nr:hypothetical protein GCM10011328_31190 [Hafnia psychrotolerans]
MVFVCFVFAGFCLKIIVINQVIKYRIMIHNLRVKIGVSVTIENDKFTACLKGDERVN